MIKYWRWERSGNEAREQSGNEAREQSGNEAREQSGNEVRVETVEGNCLTSYPALLTPVFIACSTNAGEGLVKLSPVQ